MITHEEANLIAENFYKIKLKSEKSKSKKIIKQYNDYQNYLINKLSYLVISKSNKYKQFANHLDLQQEGFEAMVMALKTYNPKNNNIIWWLNKYINTKISRAANAHSIIKIPIKKTKDMLPYKVKNMPIILDYNSPELIIENEQSKNLLEGAMSTLPYIQKEVINLLFDLKIKGLEQNSISEVCKHLNLSRNECNKLIRVAKESLKQQLISYGT